MIDPLLYHVRVFVGQSGAWIKNDLGPALLEVDKEFVFEVELSSQMVFRHVPPSLTRDEGWKRLDGVDVLVLNSPRTDELVFDVLEVANAADVPVVLSISGFSSVTQDVNFWQKRGVVAVLPLVDGGVQDVTGLAQVIVDVLQREVSVYPCENHLTFDEVAEYHRLIEQEGMSELHAFCEVLPEKDERWNTINETQRAIRQEHMCARCLKLSICDVRVYHDVYFALRVLLEDEELLVWVMQAHRTEPEFPLDLTEALQFETQGEFDLFFTELESVPEESDMEISHVLSAATVAFGDGSSRYDFLVASLEMKGMLPEDPDRWPKLFLFVDQHGYFPVSVLFQSVEELATFGDLVTEGMDIREAAVQVFEPGDARTEDVVSQVAKNLLKLVYSVHVEARLWLILDVLLAMLSQRV